MMRICLAWIVVGAMVGFASCSRSLQKDSPGIPGVPDRLVWSREASQASKNGTVTNRSIAEGGAVNDEAAIPMANLGDSQYKVGSQGDLDMEPGLQTTGDVLKDADRTDSTKEWVASALCPEGPCVNHNRDDPSSSAPYEKSNYDPRIAFGIDESKRSILRSIASCGMLLALLGML